MERRLFAIAFSTAVVACSAFGADPSGKSSSGEPPAPPPPPPGSSSGAVGDAGLLADADVDGGVGEGGTTDGSAGGCIAVSGYCVVGYSNCCGGTCAAGPKGSQARCCVGDGMPCTTAADCCIAKTSLSATCTSGQCLQIQ